LKVQNCMKLDSPQSTGLSTITHYSALCVANLLQFCCKIHFQRSETLDFTDYSTIVATLPEPTVRPPSRSFELVLVGLRGKFCWKIWGKLA